MNRKPELTDRLLQIVPRFRARLIEARKSNKVTPEKPITSTVICKAYGQEGTKLTDVEIRAMVNHLRREGYPIGSNQNGYFWALTEKELKDTEVDLLGRESAIRAAREGMMRAFQPSGLFERGNSPMWD